MSVRWIQRAVQYVKEVQDVGFFALMSDSRIFMFFTGTPLYYVMFPFMGFLLTISALFNGYHLAKARNKNLDQWFGFITSAVCAVLASISLYGAAISTAYGLSFAAGPWFFFSSVLVAAFHQLAMLGLNGYRAYESLQGSAQRMHYIQAVINNLFVLGLLTAVVGAVAFVMLFPVAPAVGSAFALTAVTFTLLNILWRFTPHNWKLSIKGLLHLGKPEPIEQEQPTESSELISTLDAGLQHDHLYHRIFTRCDYSAVVKAMEPTAGEAYLQKIITRKIAVLQGSSAHEMEKNTQKAAFLADISSALNEHRAMNKKELLRTYPLAFQSFWADKGDVEQLFDAAKVLFDKRERQIILDATPVEPEQTLLFN
ncbi:hypothetical protein [Legionella maioricensis]|uniref:Uncharacterized protein n=1 Tax=Legionella maioricensis TaxID=2896528 RepID=A0A9X2D1H8_9GAMM|nr:hypothetical protein [Legionella maioricensis]MCL9684375.1 hypothetical protein [Legionella maioricensis]MCL9687556.1 hypothetical protein [Legionella maioricensis]